VVSSYFLRSSVFAPSNFEAFEGFCRRWCLESMSFTQGCQVAFKCDGIPCPPEDVSLRHRARKIPHLFIPELQAVIAEHAECGLITYCVNKICFSALPQRVTFNHYEIGDVGALYWRKGVRHYYV
jgi:hypothetical protein